MYANLRFLDIEAVWTWLEKLAKSTRTSTKTKAAIEIYKPTTNNRDITGFVQRTSEFNTLGVVRWKLK
ncbi:MAG: hypothetical protein ACJAVI_005946 [Candidatus Azotimanducaceae bacterium]|jgi:hypothetical protein